MWCVWCGRREWSSASPNSTSWLLSKTVVVETGDGHGWKRPKGTVHKLHSIWWTLVMIKLWIRYENSHDFVSIRLEDDIFFWICCICCDKKNVRRKATPLVSAGSQTEMPRSAVWPRPSRPSSSAQWCCCRCLGPQRFFGTSPRRPKEWCFGKSWDVGFPRTIGTQESYKDSYQKSRRIIQKYRFFQCLLGRSAILPLKHWANETRRPNLGHLGLGHRSGRTVTSGWPGGDKRQTTNKLFKL